MINKGKELWEWY